MDTDQQIVNFAYTLEDGQVIEIYEGTDLPFPLVTLAENGVAATYDQETREAETQEVDLSQVEAYLEEITVQLDDLHADLVDGWTFGGALVGLIVGFLACKELLKIWLQ